MKCPTSRLRELAGQTAQVLRTSGLPTNGAQTTASGSWSSRRGGDSANASPELARCLDKPECQERLAGQVEALYVASLRVSVQLEEGRRIHTL